jgi:RNA polymerase sigma factor (sigma-70 family)
MSYIWDTAPACLIFSNAVSLEGLLDSAVDGNHGNREFDIKDPAPGPLEACETQEVSAAVAAFVNSLGEREREIVSSIYWRGETQTEVARRLGVSKMAVSKAVSKIAQRGRRLLAAYRTSILMN